MLKIRSILYAILSSLIIFTYGCNLTNLPKPLKSYTDMYTVIDMQKYNNTDYTDISKFYILHIPDTVNVSTYYTIEDTLRNINFYFAEGKNTKAFLKKYWYTSNYASKLLKYYGFDFNILSDEDSIDFNFEHNSILIKLKWYDYNAIKKIVNLFKIQKELNTVKDNLHIVLTINNSSLSKNKQNAQYDLNNWDSYDSLLKHYIERYLSMNYEHYIPADIKESYDAELNSVNKPSSENIIEESTTEEEIIKTNTISIKVDGKWINTDIIYDKTNKISFYNFLELLCQADNTITYRKSDIIINARTNNTTKDSILVQYNIYKDNHGIKSYYIDTSNYDIYTIYLDVEQPITTPYIWLDSEIKLSTYYHNKINYGQLKHEINNSNKNYSYEFDEKTNTATHSFMLKDELAYFGIEDIQLN